MISIEIVGKIEEYVEVLLGVRTPQDRNIYLGETNRIHMKARHPQDFEKYGEKIPEILSSPDYIKLHDSDGSVEYVKEFKSEKDFVKVAVRLSSGNRYYARFLYILNSDRVNAFVASGKLKPNPNSH